MCGVHLTQQNIFIMINEQETILFLKSFLGSLKVVFKLLFFKHRIQFCPVTEQNLVRS